MQLKDNLTRQMFVNFTDKDAKKIEDAARRLKVSRAEIIRTCVLSDLPKLIERETKRRNYRKVNIEN